MRLVHGIVVYFMVGLRSIATIAIFVLLAGTEAFAQVGPFRFFPDDETVDIALPGGSTRDGIIGYGGLDEEGMFKDPSDPTITFVEMGSYSRSLYVYNESKLNIDGGSVNNDVTGNSINTFGASTLTLTNGAVRRHVAFGGSKLIMTGGTLGSVQGMENSTLNITGGTVTADVSTSSDNATANVSGAAVHALNSVRGTSSMTGGTLDQAVVGGTTSVATMSLSDVPVKNSVGVNRNGTLNMTGGNAATAITDSGTISLTGGTIRNNVEARGTGKVQLNGSMVQGSVIVGGIGFGGASNALLNMFSGNVGQTIVARGSGTASFFDLSVTGDATAEGTATLTLSNVMGSGLVTAQESGRLNIIGGTISQEVAARGKGAVTVSDSDIQALGVADDGTATMLGGQVRGNIVGIGTDKSSITMAGSTVGGGIGAASHTRVFLSGGHVLGVATGEGPLGMSATDFAIVDVQGTVIENGAQANQVAELHLHSGRIVGDLVLRGGASARLGNGFEITEFLDATQNSVVKIEGGRVGQSVNVSGEFAELLITDGNVGGSVNAFDSSVSISGGTIEFGLTAFAKSQVLVTGGTVKGRVSALDTAVIIISGGEIPMHGLGSLVRASGRSHMFIAGGRIDTGVEAAEFSTVTITGGVIESAIVLRNDVKALNNGRVIVTGGDLGDNLEAYEFGQVVLSGGTVRENLFGDDNSVVTMTAGHVQGSAIFRGNSKFIRTGGTIDGLVIDQTASSLGFGGDIVLTGEEGPTSAILMHDNATLDIVGRDLDAVLVDPKYQDMFSLYELSGTLADGTSLNDNFFAIQNGSGASYHLLPVPEPATIALLLPVAILLRWRTAAMRRPQ